MKSVLSFSIVVAAGLGCAFGQDQASPTPAPQAPAGFFANSSFEVEAVAALTETSIDPDMYGVRFTYATFHQSKKHDNLTHEANISLAFLAGKLCEEAATYAPGNYDATQVLGLIGYNANYQFAPKWSAFAGLRLGGSIYDIDDRRFGGGDTDFCFVWGIGAGVKYDINERWYAKLSYDFTGNLLDIDLGGDENEILEKQHVITLGAGYKF